jgi:hypothetical protein
MEALVVTFKSEASQEQFTAKTAEHAPLFAEVDGLLAKIWLADPGNGGYGALYLFRDRAARDAYLESDLFAHILAEPSFEGISSRSYQVLDELTARTQPGIQIVGGVAA